MGRVRLAAAAAVLVLAFTGHAAAAGVADRDRDRVFDALERRLAQASPGAPVDVIVTLRGPATGKRVAALAEEVGGLGATRRFALVDAFAAELTKADVYALARLPDVVMSKPTSRSARSTTARRTRSASRRHGSTRASTATETARRRAIPEPTSWPPCSTPGSTPRTTISTRARCSPPSAA